MNIKGSVHKFGDNVDTDVIIPARYLNTSDPKELASHCMEDVDAAFSNKVKDNDFIIDVEAEIAKAEAELKHLQGFINGVRKKLSNERFVANAPEAVVALERKKEADSLEKIAVLEQTIKELKSKG